MSGLGYGFGGAVIAMLGAIAAFDARRMRIPVPHVAALLAFGAAWLALGGSALLASSPTTHAAGLVAGAGAPGLLILGAELTGRRWPIYPGDAMLLGAVGAILGIGLLGPAMAVGCGLAVAHRVCIQLRRGRPVSKGYLPAGPGLALGAALVFGAVHGAQASGGVAPAPETGRIAAVETVPLSAALPADVAGRKVTLAGGKTGFRAAVAALGAAAGIEVSVEERPARIAGAEAVLREPEPVEAGGAGTVEELARRLASGSGYGREWRDGVLVFFRYWDAAWVAAHAPPEPLASAEPAGEGDGVLGWLARLFSRDEGEAGTGPVSGAQAGAAGSEAGGEAVSKKEAESAVSDAGDEPDTAAGKGGGSGERELAAAQVGQDTTRQETETARTAEAAESRSRWEVRPETQRTLRGVLEDWALKADWRLAWVAPEDFSVGAGAVFEGEFLEAVDGLLSDPKVSRVLIARAYANRYLVVSGAGR